MPFRTRSVAVSFVTLLVCAAVGLRVHAQVSSDDRGLGHHGLGHAENHDWYKELKQLAPDGNSHICASRSGLIYCFLGGSPKS